MRTYPLVRLSALVLASMIWAAPARAQEGDPEVPKDPGVEITPFVSLGSPFSSTVGAAIAFAWTQNLNVEAEVGYRRDEINALSSNVSLLYDLPRFRRVTPYLAGGAGLEQYGTAFEVPTFGLVRQSRTAFTLNAGGGVKVPVSDRFDFRTDARWFNGVGKFSPEHWRIYNGVTLRSVKR